MAYPLIIYRSQGSISSNYSLCKKRRSWLFRHDKKQLTRDFKMLAGIDWAVRGALFGELGFLWSKNAWVKSRLKRF